MHNFQRAIDTQNLRTALRCSHLKNSPIVHIPIVQVGKHDFRMTDDMTSVLGYIRINTKFTKVNSTHNIYLKLQNVSN
jgi:hypothetical protein